MKERNSDIEQYLTDTIVGRPYTFSIGEREFKIYQPTIGMMQYAQKSIEALEVRQENIKENFSLEALRLAKEKKEECLTLITYYTCKDKEEIFDNTFVTERKETLKSLLSEQDIATLMIVVLTINKTEMLFKYLGIDKEQERLAAVMRVKTKNDKNTIIFGGQSLYGTLIDVACERYGWTKEYVVWGIDYTSLKIMLADKINNVYCSDEEMKQIPAHLRHTQDETIKVTKETMKKIKEMNWK